jgi:hypothetical protein
MDKKEILQAAYNEGKTHHGKENDVIHSLAERYVQSLPYESIERDDAIYIAFIKGAISH